MTKEWKPIQLNGAPLKAGDIFRVSTTSEGIISLEKLVEVEQLDKLREYWKDVTDECTAEFRQSCNSNGRYLAVMHDDKVVITTGPEKERDSLVKRGYRIFKPLGATYSIRVYKWMS